VLKLARQKPEKYPGSRASRPQTFKVVAVALANKMARIAWALLVKAVPNGRVRCRGGLRGLAMGG